MPIKKENEEINKTKIQKLPIEETKKALKYYTKSYEINITANLDAQEQLKNSEQVIETTIKNRIKSNERFEICGNS